MRPTRFIAHVVARWRGRVLDEGHATSSERGDTLIEILIAMTVLGIAAVALLAGFATAITSSSEHRSLASLDSSTRLAANQAIADVQQQAQTNASPFVCSNNFTPSFAGLTGFSVTAQVSYWNGTSFPTPPTACVDNVPQQYTLTVSSTGTGQSYSTTVTTVIYDPAPPLSPGNVTAPVKLVWLQQPATGVAGISITPQPEVAVEDANNNIVTSDFSSVTLQTSPGGFLSNTCFGAETYGIVQFSGCSFSKAGTYSVTAVDGSLTPTSGRIRGGQRRPRGEAGLHLCRDLGDGIEQCRLDGHGDRAGRPRQPDHVGGDDHARHELAGALHLQRDQERGRARQSTHRHDSGRSVLGDLLLR